MLNIGAAAYQNAANSSTNDSRTIRPAPPASGSASKSLPTPAAAAKSGDRVSLSPAVEVARLRESLGLQPTGKLRRQDFAARIASDRAGIQESLQAKLDALAPEAGEKSGTLTLSQDTKGQIQVAGDWPGQEALTQKLNADPGFKLMFTRLSANSGVLDYSDTTKGGNQAASLTDYLDGDSADNNLASLIQNYAALKNSPHSLASLVSLSANSGPPFSLRFNNGEEVPTN